MSMLDRVEREILRILQRDGRMANVELAARVGLSESPCLRRVRALEDRGIISGYAARVDQRSIGLQVTAFVQVSLEKDDQRTRDLGGSVSTEAFGRLVAEELRAPGTERS